MLKEGVRLDRVRGGRQKYRRNSELPYPVSSPPRKTTLQGNNEMNDELKSKHNNFKYSCFVNQQITRF